MYGLYWCPHCIEQKEMFGAAFHYVPYVECAIKGSSEMAPECKVAGVKLFPSWQFGDGAAEGRSFVAGSFERQDRVQPAVTDSAPVPSSDSGIAEAIGFCSGSLPCCRWRE